MTQFFDFDAYIAEREQNGIQFALFGKTYALPPSISHTAILELQALSLRGKDANVTYDDIVRIFSVIVGHDVYLEIKDHRLFDMDLMVNIMKTIMNAYTNATKKVPPPVE